MIWYDMIIYSLGLNSAVAEAGWSAGEASWWGWKQFERKQQHRRGFRCRRWSKTELLRRRPGRRIGGVWAPRRAYTSKQRKCRCFSGIKWKMVRLSLKRPLRSGVYRFSVVGFLEWLGNWSESANCQCSVEVRQNKDPVRSFKPWWGGRGRWRRSRCLCGYFVWIVVVKQNSGIALFLNFLRKLLKDSPIKLYVQRL